MARPGIRKINTPTLMFPSQPSKRTRIRIPQPDDRPFAMRGRDVVNQEWMRGEGGITLHKRGIYRPNLVVDPREARAVPSSQVRGSLPERIVWLALTKDFHMAGLFDFQSSQLGGRMELGGMVADFLFEGMKIVIQVQGSTHKDFLRGRKDEEQTNILKDMGYRVYELWEDVIYDASRLEDALRNIFNLGVGVGGGTGYTMSDEQGMDSADLEYLLIEVQSMYDTARMM
jgi:very-short-patch-repair endonuclease